MKTKKKTTKKKPIKKIQKKTKFKSKKTGVGQELIKSLEQCLDAEHTNVYSGSNFQSFIQEQCERTPEKGCLDEDRIHQDGICEDSECKNEICRMERSLLKSKEKYLNYFEEEHLNIDNDGINQTTDPSNDASKFLIKQEDINKPFWNSDVEPKKRTFWQKIRYFFGFKE